MWAELGRDFGVAEAPVSVGVRGRLGAGGSALPSGARQRLAGLPKHGRGNDRVHLVRVNGSDDHAVAAELPGRTAHPDFSRDGKKLAIDRLSDVNGSDPDQLYIGDADGTHLRLLAPCRPPSCLERWEPAWSPDGRRVAVSSAAGVLTPDGPSRFGLAIADVATGHVSTAARRSSA